MLFFFYLKKKNECRTHTSLSLKTRTQPLQNYYCPKLLFQLDLTASYAIRLLLSLHLLRLNSISHHGPWSFLKASPGGQKMTSSVVQRSKVSFKKNNKKKNKPKKPHYRVVFQVFLTRAPHLTTPQSQFMRACSSYQFHTPVLHSQYINSHSLGHHLFFVS